LKKPDILGIASSVRTERRPEFLIILGVSVLPRASQAWYTHNSLV